MMTSRNCCCLAACMLAMFVKVASLLSDAPCGADYDYHDTESCYSLRLTVLNFADAEIDCNTDGGNLVAVNSQAESTLVRSIVSHRNAWLGLIRPNASEPFGWTTGEQVTFWNWYPGEPNGPLSQKQCTHYWAGTGGRWADATCQNRLQYLCEKDMCAFFTCQNGGTCINQYSNYTCQCAAGYGGRNCEININECASNPCQNGGTCDNLLARYICTCSPGWQGTNCQSDIDECASNPCQNLATCNNNLNEYTCTCSSGWQGVNCDIDIDECASNPCQNLATCNNNLNEYTCTCPSGWQGVNCEIDIDECASNPCQNLATCNNNLNEYTCTCTSGWQGVNCEIDIDECASNPCQNLATCNNNLNEYTCTCPSGWQGVNCEIDIDECASNPCQNLATCNNNLNEYTCTCTSGWQGVNCEIDIDECASNPCQNLATCNNYLNEYTCTCPSGWQGVNCEIDIDECASNPCQNLATCNNNLNEYTCTCTSGWQGVNCEIDVDECASNPCQNLATCNNNLNEYTCTCPPGWQGVNCEIDVDECASNPCQNLATCHNNLNEYTCTCPSGWLGVNCEIACTSNTYGSECAQPCRCNVSRLIEDVGTQTCNHVTGACKCDSSTWTGYSCQTDVNECQQNQTICSAVVNQICQNTYGNYYCVCKTGYAERTDGTCERICTNNMHGRDCTQPCICNGSRLIHNVGTQMCDYSSGACRCDTSKWTGYSCETDINECQDPTICSAVANKVCENTYGGYFCTCKTGYTRGTGGMCMLSSNPQTLFAAENELKIILRATLDKDCKQEVLDVPSKYEAEKLALEEMIKLNVRPAKRVDVYAITCSFETFDSVIIIDNTDAAKEFLAKDLQTMRDGATLNVDGLNTRFLTMTVEDKLLPATSSGDLGTKVCDVYTAYVTCPSGKGCQYTNGAPSCEYLHDDDDNLDLTLGLSLGLGIPLLIGVVIGLVFCWWRFSHHDDLKLSRSRALVRRRENKLRRGKGHFYNPRDDYCYPRDHYYSQRDRFYFSRDHIYFPRDKVYPPHDLMITYPNTNSIPEKKDMLKLPRVESMKY